MTDQPVILADVASAPGVSRLVLSYGLNPLHLAALVASVTRRPTIDDLIDSALGGDEWEGFPFYEAPRYWPLPPGLVRVSSQEAVELGIPMRSLRGWEGSPTDHEWQWVDRRCLKRYRRKAGRR